MKKRLDTRFPAPRIKKIMQTDEDVGKIAMAVPLLVSKALELFLQDLCNRTYDITLKRGAKTLNSLHLKQCVQTFNVFDFLREIVSKVPDLGGPDAAGEDRSAAKRRKVTDNEDHSCDEDPNGNRVHEANHASGSGRGRGRGRPRGRGRGSRAADRETAAENGKFEDDPDARNGDERYGLICGGLDDDDEPEDLKEQIVASKNSETPARDFDLNVDLNESGDLKPVLAAAVATPTSSLTKPTPEVHGELPGWSFADMKKMEIDPIQLSNLHRRIDEDEEDYDEES